MKRGKRCVALVLSLALCLALYQPIRAEAKEPVVIVIDPGHGGWGGTNEGAKYGGNVEKQMTLLTAQSMKETLEQFEGVKVYLTRTEDVEVSLEDRAAIAQAYGADFLFSIHYNAKGDHSLYGTEVWTSAFGSNYAAGQTFARLHLQAMEETYGLANRGAKVKLGSQGADYYGVIRAACARNIPCVIMEHCYMDNGMDSGLVATPEQIAGFGVTDALSVARYFHLISPSLGLDYSQEAYQVVKAPSGGKALPDMTPPVGVVLSAGKADGQGNVNALLKARDGESQLLYYSYSTDGGRSWSALQPWTGGDAVSFTVSLPAGAQTLRCRVQNQYDLVTETADLWISR